MITPVGTALDPGARRPARAVIRRPLAVCEPFGAPSRPHSGPLRAFQTPRGTPGYPLKHPSKSAPSAVGRPRVGHDIRRYVDQTRARQIDLPHPAFMAPRSDRHRRFDPICRATAPSLRRPLDLQGPPGSTFPLEKSQTSAVTCLRRRDNSRREPGGAMPLQRSARPPGPRSSTPPGRTVRTRYVTVHSGHELARSSSSLDGYWIAVDAAPSLIPNIHRKSHPPPRALPPFTAASLPPPRSCGSLDEATTSLRVDFSMRQLALVRQEAIALYGVLARLNETSGQAAMRTGRGRPRWRTPRADAVRIGCPGLPARGYPVARTRSRQPTDC